MSGRLESFSLPNLSLFIVKVLTGEYPKSNFYSLFCPHSAIPGQVLINLLKVNGIFYKVCKKFAKLLILQD
jgi:hypothetical protein